MSSVILRVDSAFRRFGSDVVGLTLTPSPSGDVMVHSMWRSVLLLVILVVFTLGCSGRSKYSASVHGKVSYKGAPVTGGTLKLVCPDEADVSVGIGADGTYIADGIAAATYTVYIETETLNPKNAPPEYTPANIAKAGGGPKGAGSKGGMIGPMPVPGGGLPGAGGTPKGPVAKGLGAAPTPQGVTPGAKGTYVAIPAKYNTVGKSDLTVTVKGGSNKFDIELKD